MLRAELKTEAKIQIAQAEVKQNEVTSEDFSSNLEKSNKNEEIAKGLRGMFCECGSINEKLL